MLTVSLIRQKTYETQILPQLALGYYRFVDSVSDHPVELFVLEGTGTDWLLRSSANFRILDPNGKTIPQLTLSDGMLQTVSLGRAQERAFLYVEKIGEEWGEFGKWIIRGDMTLNVGRSEENDIVIANPLVSGSHMRLYYAQNKWSVEDCKSTNGVFVNGSRIEPGMRRELAFGDVVSAMGVKLIPTNMLLTINSPDLIRVRKTNMLRYHNAPDAAENPDLLLDETETYFYPSPRFVDPIPTDTFQIETPPQQQALPSTPTILAVGPAITMGMASAMTAAVSIVTAAANGNIATALPSLAMSVSMLAGSLLWPQLNRKYEKERILDYEKKRSAMYSDYLKDIEERLDELVKNQRSAWLASFPTGEETAAAALKDQRSLWNRRDTHWDFLTVRLGVGTVPLDCSIEYPDSTLTMEHDILREGMDKLRANPKTISNAPITLSLQEQQLCGVVGSRVACAQLAHQLLMQLAVQYSYEDVKICLLYAPGQAGSYERYRWLPHTWDNGMHLIATTEDEADELARYFHRLLDKKPDDDEEEQKKPAAHPYYVFFLMDRELTRNSELIRLICDEEHEKISVFSFFGRKEWLARRTSCVIELHEVGGLLTYEDRKEKRTRIFDFHADTLNANPSDELCRLMANTQLDIPTEQRAIPDSVSFLEMYGVNQVEHLNILNNWRTNNPNRSLKAQIGIDSSGKPCMLDVHEKRHGSHGLIAGTTGSGKSEFIMTYILSMAVQYPPEEVAFILIDYKGGGMAHAFQHLPHTVGTITNIDGEDGEIDASIISRSLKLITAENMRRQRLFNEIKQELNLSTLDIYSYQALYRRGKVKVPLPHLLIIADEFAELKMQQPDFMSELVRAARIGRSLGVHLILATQKPAGIVDDQIWSNTSFRICLKVQDTEDSNDVIKRPDAASLTNVGRFYLQVGYNEQFVLAQSGYAGAPYAPEETARKLPGIDVLDNQGNIIMHEEPVLVKAAEVERPSQLDAVARHIGEIAGQINASPCVPWPAPLRKVIMLDELRSQYAWESRMEDDRLCAVVGEYDNPDAQEQRSLFYDLTRTENGIVYDRTNEGSSQFLTTLLYDLVKHNRPDSLHIYCLDFGGGSLEFFRDAPHVGDVIAGIQEEKISQFFRFMENELKQRQETLKEIIVSDQSTYTKLLRAKLPVILVVVHNIAAFREKLEKYRSSLTKLAREGNDCGILFLFSATAANAVAMMPELEQTISRANTFALQMGTSDVYRDIMGRGITLLPPGRPGAGLACVRKTVCAFQTAVIPPTVDISAECRALADGWNGPRAQKIRILPAQVTADYMLDLLRKDAPLRLPVGLNTTTVSPVYYPFDKRPATLLLASREDALAMLLELGRLVVSSGSGSATLLDNGAEMPEDERRIECALDGEAIARKIEEFADEKKIREKPEFVLIPSMSGVMEALRSLKPAPAAAPASEESNRAMFDLLVNQLNAAMKGTPQEDVPAPEQPAKAAEAEKKDPCGQLEYAIAHAKERNLVFVVAETQKKANAEKGSLWYGAVNPDEQTGLYMGGDLTGQMLLKPDARMTYAERNEVTMPPFGFVLVNARTARVKFLYAEKEE